MNLAHHSGGCCGIRTLHGFGPLRAIIPYYAPLAGRYKRGWRITAFDQFMKVFATMSPYVGHERDGVPRGKLIEVVLTDSQIKTTPKWPQILRDNGFNLVSRFYNSTGGWCNVFHMMTNNCGDNVVPDWWTATEPKNKEEGKV